jgi:hypothetical protein
MGEGEKGSRDVELSGSEEGEGNEGKGRGAYI